jgi:hypothetical protein
VSNLSPVQIARVAYDAGFRGHGLQNAVAVALAESGGNPHAVGVNSDSYRSRDRGLWQINDHWHPEVTDAAAFSPASNAAAAYRISHNGGDFSPWSTWHNGLAQAQLGRATLAARQVEKPGSNAGATNAAYTGGGGIVNASAGFGPGYHPPAPGSTSPPPGGALLDPAIGAVTGTAAAATNAVTMATHAGAWLSDSHNWLRVAQVVAGSAGLLVGLAMLGKSGAAGSTAASVAAIPGKTAKAATKAASVAAL